MTEDNQIFKQNPQLPGSESHKFKGSDLTISQKDLQIYYNNLEKLNKQLTMIADLEMKEIEVKLDRIKEKLSKDIEKSKNNNKFIVEQYLNTLHEKLNHNKNNSDYQDNFSRNIKINEISQFTNHVSEIFKQQVKKSKENKEKIQYNLDSLFPFPNILEIQGVQQQQQYQQSFYQFQKDVQQQYQMNEFNFLQYQQQNVPPQKLLEIEYHNSDFRYYIPPNENNNCVYYFTGQNEFLMLVRHDLISNYKQTLRLKLNKYFQPQICFLPTYNKIVLFNANKLILIQQKNLKVLKTIQVSMDMNFYHRLILQVQNNDQYIYLIYIQKQDNKQIFKIFNFQLNILAILQFKEKDLFYKRTISGIIQGEIKSRLSHHLYVIIDDLWNYNKIFIKKISFNLKSQKNLQKNKKYSTYPSVSSENKQAIELRNEILKKPQIPMDVQKIDIERLINMDNMILKSQNISDIFNNNENTQQQLQDQQFLQKLEEDNNFSDTYHFIQSDSAEYFVVLRMYYKRSSQYQLIIVNLEDSQIEFCKIYNLVDEKAVGNQLLNQNFKFSRVMMQKITSHKKNVLIIMQEKEINHTWQEFKILDIFDYESFFKYGQDLKIPIQNFFSTYQNNFQNPYKFKFNLPIEMININSYKRSLYFFLNKHYYETVLDQQNNEIERIVFKNMLYKIQI